MHNNEPMPIKKSSSPKKKSKSPAKRNASKSNSGHKASMKKAKVYSPVRAERSSPNRNGATISKKEIYKPMTKSAYSSQIHNADDHNTFSQVTQDMSKGIEDVKSNIEKKITYSKYKNGDGFDWKLFRNDSPIRRRLLQENEEERKKTVQKIDRNSVTSQAKILSKAEKDPLYGTYSYGEGENPDLNYMRHKNDIGIDTAIQRERMKPSNIKKTKSRVSYHWSPKRRREMREEGDLMTGYYTERFIKDVIKDISEKQITFEEGEDYLKEFGYDLKAEKNPITGSEELTAQKISEEEASPVHHDDEKDRALHREFM